MDKQESKRESICALADGQLRGDAFSAAVALVQSDDDARLTWQSYHLVGDVLRSNDFANCSLDAGFVSRLRLKLEQESALVPPLSDNVPSKTIAAQLQAGPAANDSVFRWKMVAGFASFIAVTAVAWAMFGLSGMGGEGNSVMAFSGAKPLNVATRDLAVQDQDGNQFSPQSGSATVMIRDPNLDALLAAHKQLGNGSALQGSTGFLRNATFESPAR